MTKNNHNDQPERVAKRKAHSSAGERTSLDSRCKNVTMFLSVSLLILFLFIAPASAEYQLYSAKLTDNAVEVYLIADGHFTAQLRLLGENQNTIVQTIDGYGSGLIKFDRPTVAGNYKVTVGKVSQYFYIEPITAKQTAKLSTSEGLNFAVGMGLVIGLIILLFIKTGGKFKWTNS